MKPKVDQCLTDIRSIFLASSALQNGYRQEQLPHQKPQQHDHHPSVPYTSTDHFGGAYPDPSSGQISHLDHSHVRSASSAYAVDDSQAAAAAVAAANQYAYEYSDRPPTQAQLKYEQHAQHQTYSPHDAVPYSNASYGSGADTDTLLAATSTAAQSTPNIHPMMYPNMSIADTTPGAYGQTANHPASALMSLSRNDQTGGVGLPLEGVAQAAMWPHNVFQNQDGY